jgi:hypothetical protein
LLPKWCFYKIFITNNSKLLLKINNFLKQIIFLLCGRIELLICPAVALKVVSSENSGGSKIGDSPWVLAWDCGAGHYCQILTCQRLILNIFLFPVSTAKLIGAFYNNRQSAANSCPRFAYSFVSLMLLQ